MLGLGIAIAAISFAAIFIRLAAAPPALVAALRMVFSSLVLLPAVLRSRRARSEIAGLTARDASLVLLSGMFLAMHFMFWITSLSLTGVTSSVVFVTTNPLFVALYSVLVFRERVSRTFWIGLAVALVGGMVLGGGDILEGGGRWKGDALALAGSVAAAGYFLVGSRLRRRLGLLSYIFPVYAIAACMLVVVTLSLRIPLAVYGIKTYLYCALLALVCQLLGHSLFNWALRHLHATTVTFGSLGEPVGSSILALLILGEVPGWAAIAGGATILAGMYIVLYYNPQVTGAVGKEPSG